MLRKNPAAGGILGFFVGIGILVYMLVGPSRVYVVTGEMEYDHYMVLGSPDFEMTDGQKVAVDIPTGHCLVINNTEKRIMIEEIIYGGHGFSPSPFQISGMKYDLVETGSIDYFFDDSPPDEISVSDGTDQVSKFWLRRARE